MLYASVQVANYREVVCVFQNLREVLAEMKKNEEDNRKMAIELERERGRLSGTLTGRSTITYTSFLDTFERKVLIFASNQVVSKTQFWTLTWCVYVPYLVQDPYFVVKVKGHLISKCGNLVNT